VTCAGTFAVARRCGRVLGGRATAAAPLPIGRDSQYETPRWHRSWARNV